MKTETRYEIIPKDNIVNKTAEALKRNGINALIAEDEQEAKKLILGMIPKNAEILTMTSVTLDTIGMTKEINESGRYNSLRNKLNKMDRAKQGIEMQKIGAAPEWVIGSVHAVTEDGHVLVASNTGSQLPAYAYGSSKVIWVVGAQKIVKNFEDGLKRVYEHSLPLESERAKIAYGVPGSAVNKLLVVNNEVSPGRITVVLIKEKLGF